MKTQSNAMLINRLHKQIADIRLTLAAKQDVYNEAIKTDESFETIKELHTEIKTLKRLLKQLEAQVIISIHLAEYSS